MPQPPLDRTLAGGLLRKPSAILERRDEVFSWRFFLPRSSDARSGRPMTSRVPIATYGEALPNGTVLELVRDPASGELRLLIWDGLTASVAPRFEFNGHIYVPATLDPTVMRAVRLPERVDSYASTRELFDDVCRLVTHFTDLSEKFIAHAGYFIFGTCLVDCVAVAPFLSIVAPATAPGWALLRLLALLCRRPLVLGELSPASLCTLPMQLRPTLLVDAVSLSAPLQRLLRASNSQGLYVPRGGKPLDLFCAKAVCSQEPLDDPSLVGLALQIALAPTRRELPLLDREVSERIAGEFQSKLLMYRLANLPKVSAPAFDVGELTAPMQDLARALGACVVGDDELQLRVVSLLREQDRGLRVERSTGLRAVLLEALLFCCHEEDRSAVMSGELGEIVNTIWAGRGDSQRTTPESVGWKLRALGLQRESISGTGNGLRFTNEMRARIHELAWADDILSVRRGGKQGCRHCEELNKPREGR